MSETKRQSKAPVGATLIVISSFFYASYGIWTKLMGDYFDGFTSAVFRSLIVVLLLGLIAFVYHKLEPLNLKRNGKYILGMFIGSLFVWGPLYYAILNAGVGISMAITYASIVIGMFLFGRIFGGERLTKVKIISAILGFIGIGLIFIPSVTNWGWLALIAALVSGLSSASTTVFAKQIHYNSTQSTIIMWSAGLAANLLMAALFSTSFPTIGLDIEWVYLIIFAIASLIASWTFVRGLKLIDAGAAGILGLLEIVFAVLFGVLFFHERPGVIALIGMAIILVAASLPYIRRRLRRV
ncbi:MAG: DMT family transporter [Candidatus Microsaccharimonas sp.]